MVRDVGHFREAEILAVRVRVSIFGRVKLQIRRRLVRLRFLEDGVIEEPAGQTSWRDAKDDEALDAALFIERLQNGV